MSEDWTMPTGRRVDGSIEQLVGLADDGIGWIVFNNPARRNAVATEMWEAIPRVISAFEADAEVKLIIVTGAGRKAFVSGADISEFEKRIKSADADGGFRRETDAAYEALAATRLPTLAMIRGACIGGGMATALNCDIRIASEVSKFGIPAAKLGVGYPYGGIERLVAAVGPSRAKHVMFTGGIYGAEEALRMGLIDECVADDGLEMRVLEIAGQIAANAPLSLAAAKLAIDAASGDPAARDMDAVGKAIMAATRSEDIAEGHRAFLDKRKPHFKGR
ncbi:MAG: enoyl-CoA hydratase [Henriciella sp.]